MLCKFQFFVGGHLGFRKKYFLLFRCMGGVKMKFRAKLGENRMNGSGLIQAFVNYNMESGDHLGS